jgi:hypothetical protein
MVASQETREQHRDEIIAHYYAEFVASLKSIGYMLKPPGMLELNAELLKNGFLQVVIAICFLPFFFLDLHSQQPQQVYEDSAEGLKLRKSLYQNPSYKSTVLKLMGPFLYKGFMN